MKTLTLTTLAASLLALNIASAATLSNAEIFSAIDGESYGLHDESSRINFSVSASDLTAPSHADTILDELDGEYTADNEAAPRVNYSVSAKDLTTLGVGFPETYD